jgi:hypothetical protein
MQWHGFSPFDSQGFCTVFSGIRGLLPPPEETEEAIQEVLSAHTAPVGVPTTRK